MRIIEGHCMLGDVAVVRHYGRNRIIELTGRTQRGQFGSTVRGVRRTCKPNNFHVTPAMEMRLNRVMERKTLLGGMIVFLWFYQPKRSRVLSWLMGNPTMAVYRSPLRHEQRHASLNEARDAIRLGGDIGPDFVAQMMMSLDLRWCRMRERPSLRVLRAFLYCLRPF